MNGNMRQLPAFALLGLAMVLWAGNSIVGRAVHTDVGPFTLSFVRWAGASLILAPFAMLALLRDWPVVRRAWKQVLLLGLLGVGAFNALLYSGLQYSTATKALLIQAAVPACVTLMDRLFFGTRARPWHLVGVVAAMAGVLLIVFEGDPVAALRLRFGRGDVLLFGAVLVWSAYTVLLRIKPDVAPLSFLLATFVIGVLVMAPFAIWELGSGVMPQWSPRLLGAFAYVAVLPSLVAFMIYNSAAESLGPSKAGQTIMLMPVFGAFLSAALLGEALYSHHFVGMALIAAGIALSAMASRRQPTGALPGARLEDGA